MAGIHFFHLQFNKNSSLESAIENYKDAESLLSQSLKLAKEIDLQVKVKQAELNLQKLKLLNPLKEKY